MSEITEAEVRKIAKLARIDLKEEELKDFTKKFQNVIGYINLLDELDTDKVLPTSQVTGLLNVERDDEVKRYGDQQEILKASKLPKERQQIKVKSVF